jgi:competence protein ComEC
LNGGVSCDAIGCIGKLDKGRLVSMVREVEAFAEDCTRAAVVVSARQAPSARCAAILIDREVWRSRGSIALRRTDDKFKQTVARPADHERPWTHAANNRASGARVSAPSGDVTPRPEALEADD